MILIHYLWRKVGNEKPDPAPVPSQWGTGFPSFSFKKFVEQIRRGEVFICAVSQIDFFMDTVCLSQRPFLVIKHWIRILFLYKPGSGSRSPVKYTFIEDYVIPCYAGRLCNAVLYNAGRGRTCCWAWPRLWRTTPPPSSWRPRMSPASARISTRRIG